MLTHKHKLLSSPKNHTFPNISINDKILVKFAIQNNSTSYFFPVYTGSLVYLANIVGQNHRPLRLVEGSVAPAAIPFSTVMAQIRAITKHSHCNWRPATIQTKAGVQIGYGRSAQPLATRDGSQQEVI